MLKNNHYICVQHIFIGTMYEDINRIKVVLVEKKKTSKWLAEQLGKDPTTVSKWCTNKVQPSLETLGDIARNLNVRISDLINDSIE